jgi:short-subunit dehydrogenase
VNLRGPFLLAGLVCPKMYQRGDGTFLNIASIAAKAALQLDSPHQHRKLV